MTMRIEQQERRERQRNKNSEKAREARYTQSWEAESKKEGVNEALWRHETKSRQRVPQLPHPIIRLKACATVSVNDTLPEYQ